MSVTAIERNGRAYCYVIRHHTAPEATTFFTPDDANQQVGYVVHPAGATVRRHYHLPLERTIVGTSEVLIVREGRCRLDIYDDDLQPVESLELGPGDVMVMVGGGHGFEMLEDTVLIEVKQGPYMGIQEKRYF
jgi:mannose-6-phosphate isomerase-like protein (cupin superfamily)